MGPSSRCHGYHQEVSVLQRLVEARSGRGSPRGARTDENLSFPHLGQKHRVDAFY
jgi:hypothetical protein